MLYNAPAPKHVSLHAWISLFPVPHASYYVPPCALTSSNHTTTDYRLPTADSRSQPSRRKSQVASRKSHNAKPGASATMATSWIRPLPLPVASAYLHLYGIVPSSRPVTGDKAGVRACCPGPREGEGGA